MIYASMSTPRLCQCHTRVLTGAKKLVFQFSGTPPFLPKDSETWNLGQVLRSFVELSMVVLN
jgi:hypothetical protein